MTPKSGDACTNSLYYYCEEGKKVGIGFIVIVVLLAVLVGLFARQALANVENTVDETESEQSRDNDHHPHAM